MVSVNWLLTETPPSPRDELGLAVLDHLLLGTSTSRLRKALTDSGLGESVVGGGLSDELVQPTYSVGLKGVAKDDVPKVEALVVDTLSTLASEGFASDDLEASLNTIEFSLREFNTGSFPKVRTRRLHDSTRLAVASMTSSWNRVAADASFPRRACPSCWA